MQFNSQEEANEYFEMMEREIDKVCDTESALQMLEYIQVCYENEEKFFVPQIVMGYEEMVLSYIPEERYKRWLNERQ